MDLIMKKLLIILMVLTLTGCAWVQKHTKKNPPSDKHMICAQLKQQILFNQNHPELNTGSTYNRNLQLLSDYRKFNCAQIEQQESK